MGRKVTLLSLVVAFALVGSVAFASPSTFPGTNGKIAVMTTDVNGVRAIKTVNPDGTGEKIVVSGNGSTNPAWSPDGTKIAFERWEMDSYFHVYVVNANGTGLRNLSGTSTSAGGPSWSPDGSKIVYHRPSGISIMNADGTNRRYITNQLYDGAPSWSPNGKRIAFVRRVCADTCTSQIFSMTPSGTQITNLSRTTGAAVHNSGPDWSPDGTKIAFARRTGPFGSYKYQVVTMNADGGSQVVIKTTSNGPLTGPSWSPDGTEIAFAAGDVTYVMSPTGANMKQITEGREPSWGVRQ